MKIKILFSLLLTSLIIWGCLSERKMKPDVSNSNVSVNFYRFDKDLFSINSDSLYYYIPRLEEKYGNFFTLFTNYVINIGGSSHRDFSTYLNAFINDGMILGLYDECLEVFKEDFPHKQVLEDAFKYLNFYIPNCKIPNVYYYVSGYNQSIITDFEILGISLDKYLGVDHKNYYRLGLPSYQINRMNYDMIPFDALTAWLSTEFQMDEIPQTLLEAMIFNGKILYLLDLILPDEEIHNIFLYNKEQFNWCKKNEKKMWTYFIEEKKLFISDRMDIRRFTEDAPFTTPFSRNSPPRTANWVGWRIVSEYMRRNPLLSVEELMNETDAQKILIESKYNPL